MKKSPFTLFLSICIAWLAGCTSVKTNPSDSVADSTPHPASAASTGDPSASPSPALNPPFVTPSPSPSSPRTNTQKQRYNSIQTQKKVIAMTFDDGPHGVLTPKLLDMLKERNIKATFYVVGTNAKAHPDILRRMVAEGHEIGSHTWSHVSLTKSSPSTVASQLNQTSQAIFDAIGKKPATMRPPYGAINPRLVDRIHSEFGMKVILWSVDPLDWRRPGSSVIAQRIIQGAHPGAIILSHDIHPGTVAAMPQVFDTLLKEGYTFVTVSELIAMEGSPAPSPSSTPLPNVRLELGTSAEDIPVFKDEGSEKRLLPQNAPHKGGITIMPPVGEE